MGPDHRQLAAAAHRVRAQRRRPRSGSSRRCRRAICKKTMGAPVVAILAYDMRFFEHLPRSIHNPQARSWYETTPEAIRTTALRNATLQGAYFMIAARALGLDCGPMSGFRQRQGRRRVLPRRPLQVELPVLPRPRRQLHARAARLPLRVRRGVQGALAPSAVVPSAASACRSSSGHCSSTRRRMS